MWNPIRRTSGIRAASPLLAVVVTLLLSGCNYTFQAGAGLPPHVRTLAIVPFENETGRFELTQEVYDAFFEQLPQSFGVQVASEEHADAIVQGSIRRYSVQTPSYRSGGEGQRPEVVEREVALTVQVRVIDRVNNLILWDNSGVSATGVYAEASELEEDGRSEALEKLVQTVIDGLQSNW